jgi:hypothetical protein
MPRVLRRLLDQRARPIPPRVRTTILAVAAVGVVVASVWAWRSSGLAIGDVEAVPILVSLVVAAPLSLALKAAEYRLSAAVVGQSPGRSRSLDVAVVSSAANLLPLPGSLIVTVRSLSEDGATYGGAIGAGAVPGLAWLGVTGLVGGAAIAVEGPATLGALTMVGGVMAGIGAGALVRRAVPASQRARLGVRIIAVEVGWLAVSALRLGLAVSALGVSVTAAQALALSVAGALTVAIGFFPGGLGIREALIAGLAPLIGLPLDTGVLVGALDRVIWLVFLAGAGAVVATRRHRAGSGDGPGSVR